MTSPVKVLVVDDSRTARAMIRHAFQSHPDLVISGEAANPLEARDLIIKDQPDVITLDIEMPLWLRLMAKNGMAFHRER